VDYEKRRSMVHETDGAVSCAELLANWRDGRIKLFTTRKLLQLRREHPELFAHGSYEPLQAEGEFADHVIAFRRQHENRSIMVIVPRLSSAVGSPPIGDHWRDTRISDTPMREWRDGFTGDELALHSPLNISEALRDFPVAVLVSTT
jgi:(1->4)-alpha-D-glucan 1-alpha-D-glucosylmutase